MRILVLVSSLLMTLCAVDTHADANQNASVSRSSRGTRPVATVSADKTKLLLGPEFVEVEGVNERVHEIFPIDVRNYKTVRLIVQVGSCGPCSIVRVTVWADDSSDEFDYLLIDSFLVDEPGGNGHFATRTYDVPGQRLKLSFHNAEVGFHNQAAVMVFGRAN